MKATRPARPLRRGWLGLVATALLGMFMALLHLTGNDALQRIEGATLDWRFLLRGTIEAPAEVVIIAVDDASLASIGRWPWPRERLAGVVDRLAAVGARTIAIDILLLEPDTAAGDAALRDALARHGRNVIPMAALFDTAPAPIPADISRLALPAAVRPATWALAPRQTTGLLRPLPVFEGAALVGHVNLMPDASGTPRLHYPVLELGDALLPSFPLLAAVAQRDFASTDIALSLDGKLRLPRPAGAPRQSVTLGPGYGIPLNYFGPAASFATYSLADLMDGKIPSQSLAGRLVLIGSTATGLGDEFNTPFDSALPGVEILATAIANLDLDNYLRRSTDQIGLETLLIFALALLAWAIGQLPGPRLGLAGNLLLLVAWLALSQVLMVYSLRWLAVAGPGLGILLGATIAVVGRMVRERRLRGEVERQRGNLARYVPPTLADALADREDAAFDGREQMAAILFVDLQGFTHASESRSPTETAHFLKDFHAQLEAVVAAHGGIIAQFLGDGAFVLWGLPQPTPQDPVAALSCARDMLHRLAAWQPQMTARIGVHFGPVVMAQLGGQNQLQLTAAGDTVNVASRLEAIAKEVAGVLAISDDLAGAIRILGRHDLLAGLTAQPARRVRGRDQLLGYWSARNVADLG
jgi:adenylate cyclase